MMESKSYLSMGSVFMGIMGSSVDEDFYQEYLGMRNEYIDMSEFIRRFEEEIYDEEEFEKALEWTKENCIEGKDNNPDEFKRTREQKDEDWETVVKMALRSEERRVGKESRERRKERQ